MNWNDRKGTELELHLDMHESSQIFAIDYKDTPDLHAVINKVSFLFTTPEGISRIKEA